MMRPLPSSWMPVLLALVLASLVLARPLHAQDSAAAGPETIRFRVVIDAPRPYERMLEEGLDLVRWQHDQRMTPELLERLVVEARRAVEEAMAAEGHFEPVIRTAIEPGVESYTVRIAVEPGARTHVSRVDLEFVGDLKSGADADPARADKVRGRWSLPAGAPFRQADWEVAKRDALAALVGDRYAGARIAESEARIDPRARTAELRVVFDTGPVFHVGPIRVSGLKRYPESVVTHLSPLQPGAPYDEDMLVLYQRRLLQTGYFSTVQMAVDPDPAHADAAPLLVTVVEARSQRIDTGVSFSTDTRLRVQLDYANNDIFGDAHRLRTQLQADARAQSGEVSLDTPPMPGGIWDTVSTRFTRTDNQGQVTRDARVGVARNWGPWSTPSQISLSGHIEQKDIAGSAGESVHAVFLGYRHTLRHTDELVQPRRGVIGTLQPGTSLPGLATRPFMRAAAKATVLWPIGRADDLTLRGELGVVFAAARFGIPSTFLFRTGGDQTVRGYAFESLGVAQGQAIVGGRYLAVASAEYTRWIRPDWGAALFIDAGDAFDEPGAFRAALGYGVGARWRSPVGPFRADVAYGERTKRMRLHFSVGFTF